jgi:repressor LexA
VNDQEPLDDLTSTQRKILLAIRTLTRDQRHPPSIREVAEHLGRNNPGGLHYQYRQLEAKGYMRCEAGRPRTVEVRLPGEPPFSPVPGESQPPPAATPPDAAEPQPPPEPASADGAEVPDPGKVTWVPVAGRISAGTPITAEQSIEEYLPLPTDVVGREEGLFILTVTGDSMIGVGIFPGDRVVIRPLFQPPQNNDIVAATIDGVELEGTIKTYKKVGNDIWLMPHNPAHTPIPGGNAEFAGKVVAVLRQL